MDINNIEQAAKMKEEISEWNHAVYSIERAIERNTCPKELARASRADLSIFGKINLWLDSKNGKHEIQCGQPAINLRGFSVKLVIDTEELIKVLDCIKEIKEYKMQKLNDIIK